jgi:hypothetical protein
MLVPLIIFEDTSQFHKILTASFMLEVNRCVVVLTKLETLPLIMISVNIINRLLL